MQPNGRNEGGSSFKVHVEDRLPSPNATYTGGRSNKSKDVTNYLPSEQIAGVNRARVTYITT